MNSPRPPRLAALHLTSMLVASALVTLAAGRAAFAQDAQASGTGTTPAAPQSEPAENAEAPAPDTPQASEPVAEPTSLKVQWQPLRPGTPAGGGYVEVVLRGRTEPGASIQIKGTTITVSRKRKFIRIDKAGALISPEPVQANSKGVFEFRFKLPTGRVQLPLTVTSGERRKSYQLSLNVKSKPLPAQPLPEPQITTDINRPSVWLGVGYNYVRYEQQVPEIDSSVQYESFRGPSWYVEGRYNFSETWGTIASAKVSPGEVLSTSDIDIANGAYNWMIYALETWYSPSSWKVQPFAPLHRPSRFSLRAGVQQHAVPFLARTTVASGEVQSIDLTMVGLGLQWDVELSDTLNFEIYQRYQHPVRSSRLESVSQKFSFDGSVGLTYLPNDDWAIGLFWYGQLQMYDFTAPDALLGTSVAGSQTVFFSNAELRAGYYF